MRQIVYEYPLIPNIKTGECHLVVPKGSRYLDTQSQNGNIVSWFLVSPNQTSLVDVYTFVIIPTGILTEVEYLNYKKTVQLDDLVFHIFTRVTTQKEWVEAISNHLD